MRYTLHLRPSHGERATTYALYSLCPDGAALQSHSCTTDNFQRYMSLVLKQIHTIHVEESRTSHVRFNKAKLETMYNTQLTLTFFCSFPAPSSVADLTGAGGRAGNGRVVSSLSACATPSPSSPPFASPALADPVARDAGLGGRRTGRRGGSAMAWPFDDFPLPGGNHDAERMDTAQHTHRRQSTGQHS